MNFKMNKIQLPVLLFFCANLLVSCGDASHDNNRPTKEITFSFDLYNLQTSKNYNLSYRMKNFLSIGAMVPHRNRRLTKLFYKDETIITFVPDERVNLVTFIPRLRPTMCSVTYVKDGVISVKRFLKTEKWNQVTNENYKFRALEMAKETPLEIFDISNIEFDKIHLDEETKGDLTFYSFTPKGDIRIKIIADGTNVIWHSDDDTYVTGGHFSLQTQPKMMSFMTMNKGFMDLKFYSAYEDTYNEITLPEYQFVMKHFAYSTRTDITLNLDMHESNIFKVSSSVEQGVSFIDTFLRDPAKKVERIVAKEHTLWYRDQTQNFIKASYTVSSDPRLYKLVLCDTREPDKKYYHLYFMYKTDKMFKLPEREYNKEIKKIVYPRESFGEFDIQNFVESPTADPYPSVAYFPPFEKPLKIVKCENQLLWVSPGKDTVKSLFYFRNEDKHLVQLTCRDDSSITRTHHFQDAKSYFKGKTDDKSWVWISTPEFYRSIGLKQLIKTHTHLDLGVKVDPGAYEHKIGRVGNVMVQTFVPYSAFEITSVIDCARVLWTNEIKERLAALALYGDYGEFDRKTKEDSKNLVEFSQEANPFKNSLSKGYKLAELFIKGPQKVERQFLTLENDVWVQVKEEEFVKIYEGLENPDN
ncbi:hypothetical protein TpMuguga_02g00758 [Theileria parva strain Muguga]|uniref:Lipoprotein n=1 Tax=Theileria parva TaxID=5875 RepID=Q4N481_THEPA|nr:uncharacterized protein TpMuguga_02g00758 [Theileria parva strain Muguga]EAN33042.1 hypothetical protein TpMuguga_02g00758 [Theileria parva strain Muguga]|eukprot:XP_765325.1 hypothetical protein [Theileria parva strain Muguga]